MKWIDKVDWWIGLIGLDWISVLRVFNGILVISSRPRSGEGYSATLASVTWFFYVLADTRVLGLSSHPQELPSYTQKPSIWRESESYQWFKTLVVTGRGVDPTNDLPLSHPGAVDGWIGWMKWQSDRACCIVLRVILHVTIASFSPSRINCIRAVTEIIISRFYLNLKTPTPRTLQECNHATTPRRHPPYPGQ
jgi:hypothetical protein